MADNESDLETDGLELALDTLCLRHCSNEISLNSKDYCSEFCELVEEYTGQWQVPLPQLKVLRTALCSFTKATAAFPDDCQHIQYVLSSLALSFFELMLFFSKEEFVEEPLKDILDSFQGCHSQLLRHRNIYLQHVKQIIKGGGPWEHPVLQGILKEADLPQNDVEDFLSSELPIFLELRVRYLQACERMQEAMALAKSCLENQEAGKHLYFHQAYLTCLYKASLYENLHKEMAEIDGRDAVEIICNTERVEKDELLLSLCKAFLTQQLQNGDMYYIWDLVFIWSRLYLRAHPSRQGFLAECLQLASTATNVRAIFPFIKLVTTELGAEGVQVCVELCARALQLCDMQADAVTQSLVCKTIAFLLPHDLEICRACALLVFCQERSLEAYRTVSLLYMHPDQEPHPHNNPVRTNVRFHILQMLKERLCFDPEFWSLLTLRTYCLELMSDNVLKDAVLSEIKEEEEKEYSEEAVPHSCINRSCILGINTCHCNQAPVVKQEPPKKQSVNGAEGKCAAPKNGPLNRRKWRRSLRRRTQALSDDEFEPGDDPEIKYNLKSTSLGNKPMYSLRHNHTTVENSTSVRVPLNRKREYLSRCVKSQIFKRKGRKKRWLQGIPRLEQIPTVKEKKIKIKGKKRGRKPLSKLELSYPDNEIFLTEETVINEEKMNKRDKEHDLPYLEAEHENKCEEKENQLQYLNDPVRENGENTNSVYGTSLSEKSQEKSETQSSEDLHINLQAAAPATEASPELDGPLLELLDCPVELWHNYSLNSKNLDGEKSLIPESQASEEVNGNTEEEPQPEEEPKVPKTEVKTKRTWRDRVIRSQQYAHLTFYCKFCLKTYKGLNVMRHALSHLKSRNPRCILCGKRFKQLPVAKKHVLEHIDEMCKQKPPDKEPCVEKPPAANGIVDKVESQNQPLDACQASVSEDENPGQKSKSRSKMSSLNREERIIRNVRTLLKKTAAIYKKSKNHDTNVFPAMDFKDEQVVIADGAVTIKDLPLIKMKGEEEGEGSATTAEENGCCVDIKYYLCPSESCDRVFLRVSSTLTKHAIKSHCDDETVLEKTFVWSKRKCSFCFRPIQFLQHYKDHMKLHNSPLPHYCHHQDCEQRFSTQLELKNHINIHQPFKPQCSFTACEKLFPNYQGLFDHEWRHYVPAPQKEELDSAPSKQKRPSAEAPWKQRVKVEELWLQSRKVQRESEDDEYETRSPNICQTLPTPPDFSQTLPTSDGCLVTTVSNEYMEDHKPTINGYEDVTKKVMEELMAISHTAPAAATAVKKGRKKSDHYDVINVRDLEDVSTLTEGLQKNIGEPHITEHKTFKPEDPAYGPFVKAPFIRPPPSTYLDESVLSMRKRRAGDSSDTPPKKLICYTNKKKKNPTGVKEQKDMASEQKIRHRCDKCLSSFSSLVELQTHQALNTCSSLFGFDSDDEN